MHSSTSSFRTELRVLAVVVACLAVGEAFCRVVVPRFSEESRLLSALPARGRALGQAPGLRVLVLGDSLTVMGLQREPFLARLAQLGGPKVSLEVVAMRGSDIAEWRWLFSEFFADEGARPDVVIVNAAARTLTDQHTIELGRLATFCRASNCIDILRDDLKDFGQRVEFLQSWVFRSFAGRSRIRTTVLTRLVPYYKQGRTWVNNQVRGLPGGGAQTASGCSYDRLERFLQLARREGVKVIVVYMPAGGEYPLDAGQLRVLAESVATVVDCRLPPCLASGDYFDGVHMTDRAAGRFSAYLAERLAGDLRRLAPRRQPALHHRNTLTHIR